MRMVRQMLRLVVGRGGSFVGVVALAEVGAAALALVGRGLRDTMNPPGLGESLERRRGGSQPPDRGQAEDAGGRTAHPSQDATCRELPGASFIDHVFRTPVLSAVHDRASDPIGSLP